MRVQRTRSSPSAPHSPLTRRPLGRTTFLLGLLCALAVRCSVANGECKSLVAGAAIQTPGPDVPSSFWDTHKDGVVILKFRIGTDGSVIEPRVASSPGHDYSYLALEAVKRWRYQPATCDGRPVAINMTVTMTFAHEMPARGAA